MGPYQRRLEGLRPEWKHDLHIPPKAAQGTARKLRIRLEALAVALHRPRQPLNLYSLDQLFSEWFERSAELILKRKHPTIHAAIRAAQDRANAEAATPCSHA
jgi:hypothetical protein